MTTELFWNPEQLIETTRAGKDLYSFSREYDFNSEDFNSEDFENEYPVPLKVSEGKPNSKKRNLNIRRGIHSFLLFSEETSKHYKRRISPEKPNL